MKPINIQSDPTSKLRMLYDSNSVYNSFNDHTPIMWMHIIKGQIGDNINPYEYIKHPIWNQ